MRVIYGSQGQGGQGGSAAGYAGKGKEPVDAGRGKGKQAATGSGGATATYTEKQIGKLIQKFVDGENAKMEAREKAKEDAKAKKAKKATSAVDKARKSKKNPLDSEWKYTTHGQKKRDDDHAGTRKKNLTVGRDCDLTRQIYNTMSDEEKTALYAYWDVIFQELEDDLEDMTIVKDELKNDNHKYREYYNKALTAWTKMRFELDRFSAVYNYVGFGRSGLTDAQGKWFEEYVICKAKGQKVIKNLDAEFPGIKLPSGEYKTAPPMPVEEQLAKDVGGVGEIQSGKDDVGEELADDVGEVEGGKDDAGEVEGGKDDDGEDDDSEDDDENDDGDE
jgi:hypothetical protein